MTTINSVKKIIGPLRRPIKVFWWRLEGSEHGNFGDEITREIITTVFKRKVVWSPSDQCDLIGAGSIIEHTSDGKGDNKPFLWTSGFIEAGDQTISSADYKITGVRGRKSLERVVGDKSNISLGDAGLLASFLLQGTPAKKYKIGLLPHYADKESELIQELAAQDSVCVIDATWPCKKVIETIAQCDVVLSSSLHGLIVSDSVGTPNLHLKLSDKLKGGSYKFEDYYSIYSQPRYQKIGVDDIKGKGTDEIVAAVQSLHVPVDEIEMNAIKRRLIASFPMK